MNYKVNVELVEKEAAFFCHEAMELIKYVDIQKSVKEAAKSMGMSSAKAWKIIRGIEKALGESAVVKTKTNGVDGYNVHISPACRKLLEKYSEFESKLDVAAKALFNQIF